jgi:hypothetical protein
MVLVLAGSGEFDVEFGELTTEHPGPRLGPSGCVTGGEEILSEEFVRQFGRPDEIAESFDLRP